MALTWASGDTVTISIGNKDLLITLGGAASTLVADIAAEIAAAFNASNNSTPGTGFTWSHGGQEFAEFQDLAATVLGPVVTLTGVTAGLPHGLVVTEVTAGDGTATEANTIVATGPQHLDNPDNYLGGVLPVDNDDIYFDTGSVSALYGLTYFRTNNIDLNYYITGDWTGALGLPPLRTTPHAYAEYRQRYFQVRGGAKVFQVLPGVLGATNQGALYVDLQDQATCTVTIAASRGQSSGVPTVFLAGSDAASAINAMEITAGVVSIEPDDAPTDASKYFWPSDLTIGTPASAAGDVIVYIGSRVRLADGISLVVNGGTVVSYAPTSDGADVIATTVNGGTLQLAAAGDEDVINVSLGATLHLSGAGSIAKIFGRGTVDFRRGTGAKNCLDVKLYGGASYFCPFKTNVVQLVGCSQAQLAAFQGPSNIQLDLTVDALPT